MALEISAAGLRREVARLGGPLLPQAAAAGAALGTAGFLGVMRPGRAKTAASLAALGAGSYFGYRWSRTSGPLATPTMAGIALGVAAGGAFSLFTKI